MDAIGGLSHDVGQGMVGYSNINDEAVAGVTVAEALSEAANPAKILAELSRIVIAPFVGSVAEGRVEACLGQ